MTIGIYLIRLLSVKAFSLSGTARWSTLHFADPAGKASWFLCWRESGILNQDLTLHVLVVVVGVLLPPGSLSRWSSGST